MFRYAFFKTMICAVCMYSPFWLKGQTEDCHLKNTTTQSSEFLRYKIYYTLAGTYVAAGEANFSNTLQTLDKKPCYHFQGEGHTYYGYDWFFKVRDLYESYVDTTTLLPLKFSRKVSEGNHKLFQSVLFNHDYKRATSTNGVFKISSCIQDVLSAIYYARNIDFSRYELNQKHYFHIFLDDKEEEIYLEYLGKKKITTMYGTYQTIMFRPKLLEGTLFKGGNKMTVYVTDDKNKIPILVETPILVGKIKAYLIQASGLRNETSH